jgi:mycothiol synthase
MALVIHPCRDDDLPTLRALARHPSLADEFMPLQTDAGFDDLMRDPMMPPELRWIAFMDDTPVGFCFCFLAPSTHGSFAQVRFGVLDSHRRQGVARALLAATRAAIEPIRERHQLRELNISAWDPNPAAAALAERHGFRFARNYWRMERPRGPVAVPIWPAGIEVRTYDGTDQDLTAFNTAYNRSFAEHYHYVRSSDDDARKVLAQAHVRPEGLALAYRDDDCVGFCRNSRFGESGEVSLIGTVPEARGIGLGRALLRWGVAWLQNDDARPIYLMVDGENDGAHRLYRSEGFKVARTRVHWSRPIE